MLVYPVQAGVSLHQAPLLIERGIDPTIAAMIVSTFSLMSAVATLACGVAAASAADPLSAGADRRDPDARQFCCCSAYRSAREGYLAAGVFGFGIGAILTLLPIAWADYFGRAHFGAIRGIALPAQVLAQAAGPLLSGALHDLTGSYTARCNASSCSPGSASSRRWRPDSRTRPCSADSGTPPKGVPPERPRRVAGRAGSS